MVSQAPRAFNGESLGREPMRRIYGIFDGLLIEVNRSEQPEVFDRLFGTSRTHPVGAEGPKTRSLTLDAFVESRPPDQQIIRAADMIVGVWYGNVKKGPTHRRRSSLRRTRCSPPFSPSCRPKQIREFQ